MDEDNIFTTGEIAYFNEKTTFFAGIQADLTGNVIGDLQGNIFAPDICIFENGPIIIGGLDPTDTPNQLLQVFGGGYFQEDVGIGTTNAKSKLQVLGDVGIGTVIKIVPYDDLNNGTLIFQSPIGRELLSVTNNQISGSLFSINDYYGVPTLDVNADKTIELGPYGGNIGVGTTNPTVKLEVVGNTSISGVTSIVGNTSITGQTTINGGFSISGSLGIGTTNPITNLDIIGNSYISGSLGIGTTNPTTKLHVIGDTRITGILTVGSSSVTIDGDNNLVKTDSIQTTSNKPILNSSGSVINVYTKIDTTQAFYNTTADVDLTGLSITLTPTSINSKFILCANIVTTRNFVIAFGFKSGTTKIGKSATNINAGLGTGFTHIYYLGSDNGDIQSKLILDSDTPSTTSPITYTPFVKNSWDSVARSWYYNNRNNNDMGSTSVFTIYEVVG